ncbi:hypothetical protein Nhal_1860 [Nitrosococcus halophilus Nc 4]|uniref:Uncharacterized protein n=1 Tax=Nitrosococcus halophilus (strain Nc4) TaxID=472759 RepID=D5C369_NITHN|nr:hypothetical protein Nhal_1841 [Nitrosococcus halophilus Nc 4]ADE14977.1 hypothetical protein Nhal_1860 [Nitrosococcus halophilus Nc 4]
MYEEGVHSDFSRTLSGQIEREVASHHRLTPEMPIALIR